MDCNRDPFIKGLSFALGTWLKEYNKEYKKDYKIGGTYFETEEESDRLNDFFQKKIGLMDENYINDIQMVDNYNSGYMKIYPNYSDLALQYAEYKKGLEVKNPISTKDPFKGILKEKLIEGFEDDQEKLLDFSRRGIEILTKVKDIQELKEVLGDSLNYEVLNTLANLQDSLTEDLPVKVEAFVSFLADIKSQSEAWLILSENVIEDYENLEYSETLFKLASLSRTAKSYLPILSDLDKYFVNEGANSPIATIVKDTKAIIGKIDDYYLAEAEVLVPEILFDKIYTSKESKQDLDNKIKNLKRLVNQYQKSYNEAIKEGNDSWAKSSLRFVNQYQKELDDLVKSPEDLKAYLLGQRGDLGPRESILLAASSNPDVIIGGFGKWQRALTNKVNIEHDISLRNRFHNAWREFRDGTTNNPEEFFKKFLETVTIWEYNSDTQEIISKESWWLKHGAKGSYYTDLSWISSNLQKAKVEEDKAKILEWTKARNDFYKENRENPYTEAYYEYEEEFLKAKERLLSKGVDLDAKTRDIDREIAEIEESYSKVLGRYYPFSDQDKIKLKKLRAKKNNIASEAHQLSLLRKDLSKVYDQVPLLTYDEYKANYPEARASKYENAIQAARVLTKYREEKRKRHSSVLKVDGYDGFDEWSKDKAMLNRALENEDINREEYESLKSQISERQFIRNGEYFSDTLRELRDERKEVINELIDLSGYVELAESKDAFSKILAIVQPFRDEHGEIRTDRMTDKELEMVTYYEKLSNEFGDTLMEKIGVDPEYFELQKDIQDFREEKDKLWEEYHDLKKKGEKPKYKEYKQESDEIKEAIALLKVEQQEVVNNYLDSKPEIKDLYTQYLALNQEIAKLAKSSPNQYYQAEYDRQLNIFVNQQHKLDGTPFVVNGVTHFLEGNQWKRKKGDGTVINVTGDINNIWKNHKVEEFKESKWFQDNHIKGWVIKGVQQYNPSYAWKVTKPNTDIREDGTSVMDEYTEIDTPSFQYKRSVVKDSMMVNGKEVKLTKNVELDRLTGKLKSKGNKYQNNLDLDPKERELLEFLTNEYAIAQERQPTGQRMGYRVPSIERKFNLWESTSEMVKKKNIQKSILRGLATTEQDVDEGDGMANGVLADTEGFETRNIPHYFHSHLEKDLVSTNIFGSIMKYSQMTATNNEYKKEFETVSLAALDVMKNNKPIETDKVDSKSLKISNMLGERLGKFLGVSGVKKKYGENSRLRVLSQFTERWLYGVHVTGAGKEFTIPYTKQKIRTEKLLEKARGAKSWTVMAGLPFMKFTWATQTANAFNGVFQAMITSLIDDGHIGFTLKNYKDAIVEYNTKYMSQLAGDFIHSRGTDKSKFGKMLEYFNVNEGQLRDINGDYLFENGLKKTSKNIFFVVQNAAELFMSSTVFLAYAKSKMIGDISLFDAFDDNMNLKDGVEISQEQLLEYMSEIQLLLRKTAGNYAKLDKTLVEQTWWGAGVVWMKKFIVEFFMNRYGRRRFDTVEKQHIEGYWRSSFKAIRHIIASDPRIWKVLTGDNVGYNELTPEYKSNIKRLGLELTMITAMMVFTHLAYDDEDEDRFKKLREGTSEGFFASTIFDLNMQNNLNWALYTGIKSTSEAQSMAIPVGFDELYKTAQGLPRSMFPFADELITAVVKETGYIDFTGPIPTGIRRSKRDTYGFEEGTPKIIIDAVKAIGILKPAKYDAIERIKVLEFLKQ